MKWFSPLFLMMWSVVSAQVPLFTKVDKEDGLPTNTIYNMVQDGNQFIWLGTENGLYRYDGLQFIAYKNELSLSTGISDLQIDSEGNLRGQNFSGQIFILRKDSFALDEKLPAIGNFSPVLFNGQRFYRHIMEKVFVHGNRSDTLTFKHQLYGLFNYQNEVFAFDSSVLYSISRQTPVGNIPFSLGGETVFFTVNIQNKLYVIPRTQQGGIAYMFFPEFQKIKLPLPSATVLSVRQIANQIFIGTTAGLFVLNENLQLESMQQPLLAGKRISNIMMDATGIIWVSTLDDGLYKFTCLNCLYQHTSEPLTSITAKAGSETMLLGSATGSVYEWTQGKSVKKIFQYDTRQQIVAIKHNDTYDKLLIAGDQMTVLYSNGYTETYNHAVKQITPAGTDSFLLARTSGVMLYKAGVGDDSEPIVHLQSEYFSDKRLRSAILHRPTQTCYVATSVGLVYFKDGGVTEIKDNGKTISATDLQWVADTILVATSKGILFVKDKKIIRRWSSSNSILPDAVKRLRLQGDYVWAVAGNKLYRLSFKDYSIDYFPLPGKYDLNDIVVKNQKLYLATDKGLLSFNPIQYPSPDVSLEVQLLRFATDDSILSRGRQNILQHHDNNVYIDFSVPYYGSHQDLKTLYRINNQPWLTTEVNQRRLSFLSLEPGQYNIQLQVVAADGRASKVKTLQFTICPPYWKTWWFYTLSLLLVAGMASLLYRYRLHLIQKQNALEKQKMELEAKLRESILASVKAQMNPHFIFNALNTIQSFIYLNDKKNATTYLGKFSQLTRTILEMSNKNAVNLQEEIAALLLYLELEKTRFNNELEFSIHTSPEVDPAMVYIPSMIIQPYVENAVKHGLLHKRGEQWLKLSFDIENSMLKVTVDDNGIGRARAAELSKIKNKSHQSFATHANEKRLDALNYGRSTAVSVHYTDKVDEYGKPQGTRVTLMIVIAEMN